MCDCRKQIEEDQNGAIASYISRKYKGATAGKTDFHEVAFPFKRDDSGAVKMSCVTYSTVKVSVEGKEKPVKVTILHSYCPFCGVKYA